MPELPWGKRAAFWQMICNRDSATLTYRNPDYQEYHEHITPRMRAILLDWLIEVLKDFFSNFFSLFIYLYFFRYHLFISCIEKLIIWLWTI